MNISISKSEFKSSNGRNFIKVRNYNLNKEDIKAIVMVLHGMTECKEIYSEFAEYLAEKGYGVITYDHIGHGDSVNTEDERGFFANENGPQYLVEDLKYIISEAKKMKLPLILFGHSMGSLIARKYVSEAKEKEIDGLILCGTIGQQWAIDGVIQLAEYMIEKKGPRYRSRKLNDIVIKAFKWKFENMNDRMEWATRDKEYIKKSKEDQRMNFTFTTTGFRDVFTLVKNTGEKTSIERIPKDLPILMVSGGEDILGECSEGVKRLEQAYKKVGIKDVNIRIYPKSRHGLLHDLDRKQVFKDISDWIEIIRLAKKEV